MRLIVSTTGGFLLLAVRGGPATFFCSSFLLPSYSRGPRYESGYDSTESFSIRKLALTRRCGSNDDKDVTTDSFAEETPARPANGCIVSIDCRLRPEGDFIPEPLFDGIVLEDSDPPQRLSFVLGQGNYLPGLHDIILNQMPCAGSKIEHVSLDAGWGSRNPNLVATLSLDSLKESGLDPSLIKEGVQLELANGARCLVTSATDKEFVIDANPPLAGASYSATIELISVDPPISYDLEYNPRNGIDSKYQTATFALGK